MDATQLDPGFIVISRMGLLHRIATADSLKRTVTLRDGRTFDALEFCRYVPEHHGPVAALEVCADCIPEIDE